MTVKNMIVSALAVAAFGTITFAQTGQSPAPESKMGQPRAERMEKRRGGERKMGMRRGGLRRNEMMRGGMRRRGAARWMNFDRLNLTDAQKQRIQAIQASAKNSRESNRAQFEETRNLLMLKRQGLLTGEQGTRLTALQAQMQTQMKANMERTQNDIMAVLTADQKTLLEQMRAQRPMRREMRMRQPAPPPAPNQN